MPSQLHIEPSNDSRHERPDGTWCTVWGYVYGGDSAHAVYYVRWNDSALEEVEFIVSVGEWSEGSGPAARSCVAALGKRYQGSLSFMLVDAGDSSFNDQAFLGAMRSAAEVRGTALAQDVFRILDEMLAQDERVAALRARLET